MMIPISEDINTEEELGTMNLEAPVYECYSHGAAFGVRLPSGEQTAALFADIRAAQAVADYFTAVPSARCRARSPTRSCPAFMRRTERALFKTKNAGHSQRPCPAFQLGEKASLLRQAAYEQGLRPRSPRTARGYFK